MMSCTTPGIWFGDPDETKMLAREMNEVGAKIVSDHRTRFGLFALVPLPMIDPSLKEIEYAFDTLKADGVGLVSSYGNHWLGDPMFRPVMDELNRRRAVVYVHPTDAPCCQELFPDAQPGAVEYNTDTARTIFSLLYNGSATRYNNIRFIFSHGGGTMPSLVERFGVGRPDTINQALRATPEPNSRLYHLRRFYYDTAQSTNIVQMTALKTVAGAQQIVYGTDYPFGSFAQHTAGLKECGFTPNELEGVFRRNALRLFPRLNA
jgi:predicted TIM-barrel fold metal-dependent hydrolase